MDAAPTRSRSTTRRWRVHLVMMVSLVGALVTLATLSHSITVHVVIGLVFVAGLSAHLVQRRRTLIRQWRGRGSTAPARRTALSDAVLELLALNVVLSGVVDAQAHHSTVVPGASLLHLPPGMDQSHKLAGLVFSVYVIVHVVRRRRRLRASTIS